MKHLAQQLGDTIVALATPPGLGAIGVIRLSGNKAIEIAAECFYGKDLSNQKSHTLHLGTIRDEKGLVIDEVLASLFKAPKSYTKENVVEVSCHGSPYILQRVIELFVEKGARMAKPGEFTLRAFLNGQMDLSQAEAVADLIASSSEASHDLAMRQMRGGFSDQIQGLRQELIDFAALIELELDFGEEDVEFADREDLRLLVEKIQKLIRQLMDSFQLGNVLKTGVSTVIAGRPNAGKSTLLNAFLNEERAIVSAIAGTTRDVIEENLNINGVQFRLGDTAGIREAQDQIESIGVEKTFEQIKQSSVLLYVFDVTTLPLSEVEADLQKLARADLPVLVIGNKIDLLGNWSMDTSNIPHKTLFISAGKKENIEAVRQALFELVIKGEVQTESTIVTNARHFDALQKSDESLSAVLTGMASGITSDFVAMDIRASLHHLGQITGEIHTDDLLDSIFSRFCIGK